MTLACLGSTVLAIDSAGCPATVLQPAVRATACEWAGNELVLLQGWQWPFTACASAGKAKEGRLKGEEVAIVQSVTAVGDSVPGLHKANVVSPLCCCKLPQLGAAPAGGSAAWLSMPSMGGHLRLLRAWA